MPVNQIAQPLTIPAIHQFAADECLRRCGQPSKPTAAVSEAWISARGVVAKFIDDHLGEVPGLPASCRTHFVQATIDWLERYYAPWYPTPHTQVSLERMRDSVLRTVVERTGCRLAPETEAMLGLIFSLPPGFPRSA